MKLSILMRYSWIGLVLMSTGVAAGETKHDKSFKVRCAFNDREYIYHPVVVDVASRDSFYTLYFEDLTSKYVPINSCIVDMVDTKFNQKRLMTDAKYRAKYNIKQHKEVSSW